MAKILKTKSTKRKEEESLLTLGVLGLIGYSLIKKGLFFKDKEDW